MKGGVRKRYGSWYYYFDLGTVDGERRKIERKAVGAVSKGDALKILRRAIIEYENAGTIFEPSEITVHDFFKFWFDEYVMINLKYNSQENYRRIITNHINPAIGKFKLRSSLQLFYKNFLTINIRLV